MNGWLLAFSESRGTQERAGQNLIQAGPKPEVADRAGTRAGLLTSSNNTQELAITRKRRSRPKPCLEKEPRQTEAAQNKGRRPHETRPKSRPLMIGEINWSRIMGFTGGR
jgi:hypothetical protein